MTKISIPSTHTVAALLAGMTIREIVKLAAESEVPYGTLLKIRSGHTKNPGIETVRKIWPLLVGGGA